MCKQWIGITGRTMFIKFVCIVQQIIMNTLMMETESCDKYVYYEFESDKIITWISVPIHICSGRDLVWKKLGS